VTFTGRVDYDRAGEYLGLGDIAVSAKLSTTEANGKLYNYMACGLPSVVFDSAVNREILGDHGNYARLGDASALAAEINNLLDHPAERGRARAGAARAGGGRVLVGAGGAPARSDLSRAPRGPPATRGHLATRGRLGDDRDPARGLAAGGLHPQEIGPSRHFLPGGVAAVPVRAMLAAGKRGIEETEAQAAVHVVQGESHLAVVDERERNMDRPAGRARVGNTQGGRQGRRRIERDTHGRSSSSSLIPSTAMKPCGPSVRWSAISTRQVKPASPFRSKNRATR